MNGQEAKQVMQPPNNTPYLIAIVIMALVAIMAIVLVAVLRPAVDNTPLYVLILGSIGPTTLALLAFMKSQETHLSVNSRLDQFIKNADRSARAEGELAGRAAGRQSADIRTDTLKVEREIRADVLKEQAKSSEPESPLKVRQPEPGKAHLEIAATLVGPVGIEATELHVEELAGTIRPKDKDAEG